jgi:Domain of unknown function (DUF4386)
MITLLAVLLIVAPVLLNGFYAALSVKFQYPKILRLPSAEVLEKFNAGGTALLLLWEGFALSAALFIPISVLSPAAVCACEVPRPLITSIVVVGVLGGLVQVLGLVRWPFAVPYLARISQDQKATPTERETARIVFQALNRYIGVAVGEHLGYALTGLWGVLLSTAMLVSSNLPAWIAIAGIVIGAMLLVASFEFVGPFENKGSKVAGFLVTVGYLLLSVWMVVLGILLLL